jgi:hypothetical protein
LQPRPVSLGPVVPPASQPEPTPAVAGLDALGRDWLDQAIDTLILAIGAKGEHGHILPGPARVLLENDVRSRLASQERDARLGAALREVMKSAEYHTLRIIPMMLGGCEVRISGVGVTEEGNALAALLRASPADGGTTR